MQLQLRSDSENQLNLTRLLTKRSNYKHRNQNQQANNHNEQSTSFNVVQPSMAYIHEWIPLQAALLNDSRNIVTEILRTRTSKTLSLRVPLISSALDTSNPEGCSLYTSLVTALTTQIIQLFDTCDLSLLLTNSASTNDHVNDSWSHLSWVYPKRSLMLPFEIKDRLCFSRKLLKALNNTGNAVVWWSRCLNSPFSQSYSYTCTNLHFQGKKMG